MSSIYVSETTDRKEFVTKIIEIFKQQIDKASTIFIKPNIVSFEPYPTTTHPETLDTILTLLSNKDIINSWLDCTKLKNLYWILPKLKQAKYPQVFMN
jgi:uncharacterized protein (DUF362 family)